jgi:hypothetical protein
MKQAATRYDQRKPTEKALQRLDAWSLPGSEVMARMERDTQELGKPTPLLNDRAGK